MKSGAQVGSYSVSRTFQVKENIEVIKVRFPSRIKHKLTLSTCHGWAEAGSLQWSLARFPMDISSEFRNRFEY